MAPVPHHATTPEPFARTTDSTAPGTWTAASTGPAPVDAAALVLEHFAWIDGHADTWSMLRDPASLAAIAAELTRCAARHAPDLVMGIEARGLVLAPMVALGLGVGFSPLRSGDAMLPGPTSRGVASADYRGRRRELALRSDHLSPGARVVIVDDWIETGSQVSLARDLLDAAGAELRGIVVIVDETSPSTRRALPPISSIVRGDDLP